MIPARGPFVEVEHPTTSYIFTPVPKSITPQPKANARPSVEIAVGEDEKWRNLVDNHPDTQIPLRLWEDGERRPIDSLDDVRDEPGQSVLIGSGGRELRKQVSRDVDQSTIPQLVRDLVSNNTSYTANVDSPPTTRTDDTKIISLSTTSDFRNRTFDVGDVDPVSFDDDTASLLDSGFPRSANADRIDDNNIVINTSAGSSWFGGAYIALDSDGAWVEYEFKNEYRIRAQDMAIQHRAETPGDRPPTVEIRIDGNVIESYDVGGGQLLWRAADTNPITIEPGTHTVRFEAVTSGGSESNDEYRLDIFSVYDTRYNYTFGDPSGGEPEEKPDAVDITFDGVPSAEATVGGRVDSTWSSTSNQQAIALSNTQGGSFELSASNSATLDGDFSAPKYGPSLTFQATLSRGAELQDVTLFADTEDMPLAVNKTVTGSLEKTLATLANEANALYEFRRESGTESVEYAAVGQRTSDDDPALSNWSRTVSKTDITNKAIVFGRSQRRRDESFIANHGTAIDLRFGEIHEGSEKIRDPDTGRTFQRGVDYSIDYGDGTITTKSDGNIVDGEEFLTDYVYQARGTFANGDETPITTIEQEFPGLTAEMTVTQAARIIVEELQDPLVEATATAPPDELGWTVIEEIDPPDLPGGAVEIQEIRPTNEQIELTLASRRTLDEVFEDLNSQLSTVSRRT